MIWLALAAVGLGVGTFGSLIGVAGGLLLVPILLFLYPHDSPANITSTTLAVAFLSALSGSIAYGRLKRIDYRSGIFFSLSAVPGSVIGASITTLLNRNIFQIVFGISLIMVAIYLLMRPEKLNTTPFIKAGRTTRKITDSSGNTFSYSFSLPVGMAIAFGVGLVGGLLGIGGGIMHVPVLTQILGFPTHIATATSQFVVATTTIAAVTVHAVSSAFTQGIPRTAALSAGAIVGAQIGARLSQRISGPWIVRLLALALCLVAVRLLIAAIQ